MLLEAMRNYFLYICIYYGDIFFISPLLSFHLMPYEISLKKWLHLVEYVCIFEKKRIVKRGIKIKK